MPILFLLQETGKIVLAHICMVLTTAGGEEKKTGSASGLLLSTSHS